MDADAAPTAAEEDELEAALSVEPTKVEGKVGVATSDLATRQLVLALASKDQLREGRKGMVRLM